MKVFLYPPQTITSGPVRILLDGVSTEVSSNTGDPIQNINLPVFDYSANQNLGDISAYLNNISNATDLVDAAPSYGAGMKVMALDSVSGQMKYFKVDPSGYLQVSAAALPLPSGAATSALQTTGNSSLSSIDGKLTTLNGKDFSTSALQTTGNSSLSSIDGKLTTLNAKDFATSAKQDTGNTTLSSILSQNADIDFTGSVTPSTPLVIPVTNKGTLTFNAAGTWTGTVIIEASLDNAIWVTTTYSALTSGNSSTNFSAPTSGQINTVGFDYVRFRSNTISSGSVTMVLQASRLVSNIMIDPLPTGSNVIGAVSQSGTWNITNVSGTVSLPTGASTLAEQQTQTTALGSLTETAPATDTASSGLNGRLQRIAQRLTSLIALLPSSIGTKASAASLSVVLASDQATIPTQTQASSGTITNTQKSVGLTAVRATVSGSAPGATRKKLMLKPSKNNTGAVYLGSSSVTTSNGLEIIGPDRLEFTLDASDYYLISDTASQVVEIIEVV